MKVVKESKLELLSYHCYNLRASGLSCVSILLDSHISINTWPAEGILSLDVFTSKSSRDLMPVLPILEKLFGVPKTLNNGETFEPPFSRWVHKLRGFRSEENYLSKDIGVATLDNSQLHWKQQVSEIISIMATRPSQCSVPPPLAQQKPFATFRLQVLKALSKELMSMM